MGGKPQTWVAPGSASLKGLLSHDNPCLKITGFDKKDKTIMTSVPLP